MTYQFCARISWRLGVPLKTVGCVVCFLAVPTAASANPVASALKPALHAPALRYVQKATDANGSQSLGDGQREPAHAPGQMHVPDQETRGVWRRRHTRGLEQKETVPRNPERISAEGQRPLSTFLSQKRISENSVKMRGIASFLLRFVIKECSEQIVIP